MSFYLNPIAAILVLFAIWRPIIQAYDYQPVKSEPTQQTGECPTSYQPVPRLNVPSHNASSIPRIPFMEPAEGVLDGSKVPAVKSRGRDLHVKPISEDGDTDQPAKKLIFDQITEFKLDEYCTDQCDGNAIYRTADGSCNNLEHPNWGRSLQCFSRLLPPVYDDGMGSMKKLSVSGDPLPGPPLVSNVIHNDVNNLDRFNRLHMAFGQFLDHDMTFTPFALRPDRLELRCCKEEMHPACETIRVPKNDPFYSQFGEQCLEFVRSHTCVECGAQAGEFLLRDGVHGSREQLNKITSWLDLSLVYGNSLNITTLARAHDGTGKLHSSSSISCKELLPLAFTPDDQCARRPEFSFCFGSGDIRVNQQPPLTVMHLMFQRQHNRIADGLAKLNPHWDDETLFQQARRIVSAQMQIISYNEYLPIVVGELVMNHYKLHILQNGYTDYDSTLDPTISNEFRSAAFRFAHSQVDGLMSRITVSGEVINFNLRDIFFQPHDLLYDRLDDLIRGLIYEPTQSFDPFMTGDLRNHLLRVPTRPFGSDLASMNIQRGRDAGMPGYTEYLNYCYNVQVEGWQDLERFIQPERLEKLKQIYTDPADVDLWTGGLVENRMEGGGMVGPVFSCIIGIQFHRVKFSDRFWFEHKDQVGSFTRKQLQSLRKTRLAKLLCQNSDHILRIHLNIFEGYIEGMPLVDCGDIPDVDLSLWKDRKRHPSG